MAKPNAVRETILSEKGIHPTYASWSAKPQIKCLVSVKTASYTYTANQTVTETGRDALPVAVRTSFVYIYG